MRLRYYSNGKLFEVDASEIIISQVNGDVISVYHEEAPNVINLARIGDKDYDFLMKRFGIKPIKVKEL